MTSPGDSTGDNPGGTTTTPLTEAERVAANANLLARISPFLTTPVVQQPVTLFFYNDAESQSRTVTTSDAGHFATTAALPFVPTHVRVLVSGAAPSALGTTSTQLTAPLAAVAAVPMVGERGVSLISDIDDTIKTSNIGGGAREMFRSTFVRDLDDMAVDGTRAWYGRLAALGVQFHYCSNSPWQLFPVLTAFFQRAGLPRGPLHLKQYSGMLQGIFEPVAERKRGTLERLLRDFPQRRFLLVGDSGEADLEVYTELVLAHPGRVLAIFVRDVTTPEQPGYFDGAGPGVGGPPPPPPSRPVQPRSVSSPATTPPPPRSVSSPVGPVMGTLIDLSDDSDNLPVPPAAAAAPTLRKPVPPPRPSKPMSLRSSMATATAAETTSSTTSSTSARGPPPPPPTPRRKPVGSAAATSASASAAIAHPLAQVVNSSSSSNNSSQRIQRVAEPPLPPLLPPRRARTGFDAASSPSLSLSSSPVSPAPSTATTTATSAPSKKVDMWRRRLAYAQSVLGPQGVALYTWRRGQDVVEEAVGIVKAAMERP